MTLPRPSMRAHRGPHEGPYSRLGMLLQTSPYLVDLYFVAKLGDAAIAGVSAAGNVFMIVLALTQMLGVGTVALVSHAAGRRRGHAGRGRGARELGVGRGRHRPPRGLLRPPRALRGLP